MTSLHYNWGNYLAIEEGDTLFARRNFGIQSKSAEAAGFLEERVIEALEFGTAKGGTAGYFLERLPGMNLACLDTDGKALEIAKNNLAGYGEKVSFIEGDFLSQNAGKPYDLVFGVFVVHNFPDEGKTKFFAQACDLLKKGGIFVIGDVMTYSNEGANRAEWSKDYKMIQELGESDYLFWKRHFDEYDRKFSSPAEWNLRTLTRCGFDSAEVTYRDGFWTVISAQK